ncbi:MAG: zinc-ribbon and DUF3426 domain-containing protein [Pusillimonas sp.]
MNLTTQCPECGTVFSASVEQMKRRKGYIRCEQCAAIFDGFDAVVDDKETASAPVIVAGAGTPPADERPVVAGPATPRISGGHESFPAQEPHFVLPGQDQDPVPADSASSPEAPAVFVEPRRYRGGARTGSDLLPGRHRADNGGFGLLRWLAVVLVLVAVVSLLMYAFRAQIATEAPQLRPLLEKACDSLDCTVDYPQRLDRISIMDSTLQVVPDDSASMALTVVMRNTLDKDQQWPALMLEMSDLSGAVVARRVYQPADYLDGRQLQGPFGAGQEVRLTQRVPTNGLQINGFQIKKFFPPKD